jgi:ATP-dependent DNA ligase
VQKFGDEGNRFIRVAPKQVCDNTDHLGQIFNDIMAKGGEGIILRNPLAPFTHGRCPGFLKHKVASKIITF